MKSETETETEIGMDTDFFGSCLFLLAQTAFECFQPCLPLSVPDPTGKENMQLNSKQTTDLTRVY